MLFFGVAVFFLYVETLLVVVDFVVVAVVVVIVLLLPLPLLFSFRYCSSFSFIFPSCFSSSLLRLFAVSVLLSRHLLQPFIFPCKIVFLLVTLDLLLLIAQGLPRLPLLLLPPH